jgi:hypothetical protein
MNLLAILALGYFGYQALKNYQKDHSASPGIFEGSQDTSIDNTPTAPVINQPLQPVNQFQQIESEFVSPLAYAAIGPAAYESVVTTAELQYKNGDGELANQLLDSDAENMSEDQIRRLNTLFDTPIPLSTYQQALLRDPTTTDLDNLVAAFNYYARSPQKIFGSYNRVSPIQSYNRNTYSDYSGQVMVEVVWDTTNGPFIQVVSEDNFRDMLIKTIDEISSKNSDTSHLVYGVNYPV